MSTEWITDRLPTKEDALSDGSVWMMAYDGRVIRWSYDGVELGRPWQPITKPAPYVKPKRWTVEWCNNHKHYEIRLNRLYICLLPELICDEIAQRIEDLFNEVMP
jgi:hypothetical protein